MEQAVKIKPSHDLQDALVQPPSLKAVYVRAEMKPEETAQETGNKRNWVLPGMAIGGLIGGALALRDEKTKTSLKESMSTIKEASANMLVQLRTNPGGTLKEWGEQIEHASSALKQAQQDAEEAYRLIASKWQSKNRESQTDTISMLADLTVDVKEAAMKAQKAISHVSEAGKAIQRPFIK